MEACVEREHTHGQGHFEQLSDDEVAELLRFVDQSFAKQRLGASLWYSGWTAFNVANVAIGSWKIATVETHRERDTWLMSTIGAGLFLVGAMIMPLPGLYGNLRLSRLPENTPGERRAKLRRALIRLEIAAQGEDRNSNLTAHLGGLFYALFSTGYIYFHNPHSPRRDLYLAAGLQLLASIVGAEATLWSVPRKARRDLESIKARACGERKHARYEPDARAKLSLGVSLGSLGLRLSF